MRGFLSPAVRPSVTDSQKAFRTLSRHRRSKLATAANTSLVKADQWCRGIAVDPKVAAALDTGLKALRAKHKG
jgi:hypothetical protein